MYKRALFITLGILMTQSNASELEKIFQQTIDEKIVNNICMSFHESNQTTVKCFSRNASNYNENTVFQIGSLTKGIIGSVVAILVNENKLSLEDKIEKFFTISNKEISNITLKELLTHTSGLPRLHPKFNPGDNKDPYKEFDDKFILKSLESTKLEKKVFSYSNFALAVIQMIVEKVEGKSIDDVVQQRITRPLNMKNTDFTLKDVSQPYNQYLNPTPAWTCQTYKSAGALRSTISDLNQFAMAILNNSEFFKDSFKPLLKLKGFEIGYLWGLVEELGIIVHEGQTLGNASIMIVDQKNKRYLNVLSDTGIEMNFLLSYMLGEKVKVPSDNLIKKLFKVFK